MSGCTDLPTGPQLGAEQVVGTGSSVDNQTVQGCVIEGYCVLPPISGGGSTCDPHLQLDWSCDDGGGDCMTSQPGTETDLLAPASCPEPRNPRGGDGYDPMPGDTCNTGDPAFDSPAVKQGLQDLWSRSNPTAPQAQRLEQAGWIVQDANGSFRMAPFTITTQGPCHVNGNFSPPAGAVAWVHTHPFQSREVQTICGALKQADPSAPGGFRDVVGPDGRLVYPEYRNKPSTLDHWAMNDVNAIMARLGRNALAGVIIDADHTTVYTENPGDGTTVLPRCFY